MSRRLQISGVLLRRMMTNVFRKDPLRRHRSTAYIFKILMLTFFGIGFMSVAYRGFLMNINGFSLDPEKLMERI